MAIGTIDPPEHMWIDKDDALQHIDQLLSAGLITHKEAECLGQFKRDGFIILENAVDGAFIDCFVEDLENLYTKGDQYLLRMPKGEVVHPYEPTARPKSRLLDVYVNNEHARNLALSFQITRFLYLLYEEPPLLFQSLLFTWGTEHSIHADNTYIVCQPPCALIACWLALEDIIPGSGELVYYPGSHKNPLVSFADQRIEWHHKEDGKMAHVEYTNHLKKIANDEGTPCHFIAKKGDLMIWHANLIHYGSKVVLDNQTRKSFLTHYCPALTGAPNYFGFYPEAVKKQWGDGFYSSRRYDLRSEQAVYLPSYKK